MHARPLARIWLERIGGHVTPYRFCWGLAVVCFLIAWNRGMALLYAVVALTVAALLLSHLLAWLNLRGVRARREKIAPLAVGEAPVLQYRLTTPGARYFLLLHEPALDGVGPTLVVQSNGHSTLRRELDGLVRGVYPLTALQVSTAYPFGLHSARREIAQPAQELIVYPRWHEVGTLPAPRPARARHLTSEMIASRRRGWDEFAGVREQRPGEGIKHVHWRASARQRRLMVKQYETLDTPGLLLVLPQQPGFERGQPPASCFEYAIELAVSLVRAATRAGYPVHVLSHGRRATRWDLAPHTAELSPTLAWFARCRAEGATPLTVAMARALDGVRNCGWIASFRHRHESAPALPPGAFHFDFAFAPASFAEPAPAAEAGAATATAPREPLPGGMRYHVSRDTDLERLLA